MFTELIKERDSIVAQIPVQSVNNASVFSTVVDMSKFNRVEALLQLGAGTTGTLNMAFYESDNANGAGNTLVTGAYLTPIVNGTNQVAGVEVKQATLTKRYVVVALIESQVIAKTAGVTVRGTEARYHPCTDNDVNTVVQRVAV